MTLTVLGQDQITTTATTSSISSSLSTVISVVPPSSSPLVTSSKALDSHTDTDSESSKKLPIGDALAVNEDHQSNRGAQEDEDQEDLRIETYVQWAVAHHTELEQKTERKNRTDLTYGRYLKGARSMVAELGKANTELKRFFKERRAWKENAQRRESDSQRQRFYEQRQRIIEQAQKLIKITAEPVKQWHPGCVAPVERRLRVSASQKTKRILRSDRFVAIPAAEIDE